MRINISWMAPASLVLLFCLTLVHFASAQDDIEFSLIKKEGNISIYERWVTFPGSDPPQAAREVKGEFTIRTTPLEALKLIKDEERLKSWQSHVSEFKVHSLTDTSQWYEYSYHDIPWPVSDQDHLLIYRLKKLAHDELLITFKSFENKALAPERKGVTRMKLQGSWRLTKISDTQIKATYRIISQPIGIPKFITDPIVRRNLMSTIESFVELLEKEGS
ncbi:MAG: hypothetical protein RLN86_03440 [Cyclobacteriaceae bacterium]